MSSVDLALYGVVRIARLLREPNEYDGEVLNKRSPQIGDTGYVVEILQASGLPNNYVVECSGSDGTTLWLGEFLAEELGAVS